MFKKNEKVEFHMPVDGVSTGIVSRQDGAYIYINVQLQDDVIEIERYETEVKKVLDIDSS